MNSEKEELDNQREVDERLYYKVQNIIKYAKIERYITDRDAIWMEGLHFFGNITGRNSLQLERMKNVKLKIELVQAQKIEPKETYDYKEMLSDIYACALSDLSGQFTPEMKAIYNKIKKDYAKEKITDEEVYQRALEKIVGEQSFLPVIHTERVKGLFCETKNQIEFYKLENTKLQNEIILERGKCQFSTFDYYNNNASIIIPVNVKNAKKSLTNA